MRKNQFLLKEFGCYIFDLPGLKGIFWLMLSSRGPPSMAENLAEFHVRLFAHFIKNKPFLLS